MPALDSETRERWRDMVVVDRESATVGTIETFYLDQASGLPTWALVHTGWLGDRRSFVPLAAAVEVDGEIRLPYSRAQIREAPQVTSEAELSADDELLLYGHYGLHDHHGAVAERPSGDRPEPGAAARGEPAPAVTPSPGPPPVPPAVRAGPPPAAGEPGLVVTRSEEELRVGLRTRLRRLRLRRYVVTEYVTRTIPVRREKVRLEELPSGQVVDGGADGWPPAGEAGVPELEVVLYREEPVIQLRTVPVERVRLVKRLVTEQHTVTEELRKEQVEVDADQGPPQA
jgi:hypothetical protein